MTEEVLFKRGTTLVRRLLLAPGEALPWHRDPFDRVTLVLQGDALTLEYQDDRSTKRIDIEPHQVDWDEPNDQIHRAVNTGKRPYEEVVIFLMDDPDAVPQPGPGR